MEVANKLYSYLNDVENKVIRVEYVVETRHDGELIKSEYKTKDFKNIPAVYKKESSVVDGLQVTSQVLVSPAENIYDELDSKFGDIKNFVFQLI